MLITRALEVFYQRTRELEKADGLYMQACRMADALHPAVEAARQAEHEAKKDLIRAYHDDMNQCGPQTVCANAYEPVRMSNERPSGQG